MDLSPIIDRLSPSPEMFPDCCLAISRTLITYLASILPQKPGFTISIGSGSGLLEALIAHCHPTVRVEGVEVNSSVNRYLPEEDIHVVGGTWGLHSRVSQARAWMFVYPREPKLVTKYLDEYSDKAEVIVWLGPRVDWADYEPCFRESAFSEVSLPADVGVAPYEMLVVLERKS
ncbi:hypothetical protein HFD88_004782 [Aspergillus terreus]|nr:hypothetical protein HFD88_004782 [Aspergillus terreus]